MNSRVPGALSRRVPPRRVGNRKEPARAESLSRATLPRLSQRNSRPARALDERQRPRGQGSGARAGRSRAVSLRLRPPFADSVRGSLFETRPRGRENNDSIPSHIHPEFFYSLSIPALLFNSFSALPTTVWQWRTLFPLHPLLKKKKNHPSSFENCFLRLSRIHLYIFFLLFIFRMLS